MIACPSRRKNRTGCSLSLSLFSQNFLLFLLLLLPRKRKEQPVRFFLLLSPLREGQPPITSCPSLSLSLSLSVSSFSPKNSLSLFSFALFPKMHLLYRKRGGKEGQTHGRHWDGQQLAAAGCRRLGADDLNSFSLSLTSTRTVVAVSAVQVLWLVALLSPLCLCLSRSRSPFCRERRCTQCHVMTTGTMRQQTPQQERPKRKARRLIGREREREN